MPRYTVKDNTSGKTITFDWHDAAPPSDADMEAVFTQARGGPGTPAPADEGLKTPEWAGKHPTLYGLYGAAKETLPVLGSIAGEAAGPLGIPLGFAGGEALKKLLETQVEGAPVKPVGEVAKGTAEDIAKGGLAALGGVATGGALKTLTEAVPKGLYRSALKLPTTMSQEARNLRIETGLREMIGPSEAGLDKLQLKIDALGKKVDDVLVAGAKKGAKIKTDDIVKRLEGIREFYGKTGVAQDMVNEIDYIEQNFIFAHGKEIPVKDAQEIKKNIYAILKKHYGQLSTAKVEAKKNIARGVKEELENLYPELKLLNKNQSALIKLNDSIERSIGRIQNKEVIGLGVPMAATAGKSIAGETESSGLVAALIKATIDNPHVKSSLAFALRSAKPLADKRAGELAGRAFLTNLGRSRTRFSDAQATEQPPAENNTKARLPGFLRDIKGVIP